LDALAQNFLSFTQCYNSARCSPTRASLLTGLTPHQAGVASIGPPLSSRAVTLAEVLAPAGYDTSMVGKWHLTERNTPWIVAFKSSTGRSKRQYGAGQFYATNAFADYSIDFITQAQKAGKPWFQYLAFNAPHFPRQAPEEVVARYEKVYSHGWDKVWPGAPGQIEDAGPSVAGPGPDASLQCTQELDQRVDGLGLLLTFIVGPLCAIKPHKKAATVARPEALWDEESLSFEQQWASENRS
jgi:arylsulfatase A-like enzyme